LAVKIRLRRTGAKKRPTFRFVATDSRMPRDGRFLEILGYYNPIEKPATVGVKEERVYYWLKQGATPSDTVSGLFKQIGLWKKWEMVQKGEDISQITLAAHIKEKAKKKKRKKGKETEAPAPAAEVTAPKVEAEVKKPKEEKKEEKEEEKPKE
jgi:small subunit ribosomal protein S16